MVPLETIKQGCEATVPHLQRTDLIDDHGAGLPESLIDALNGPVERRLSELEPTDRNGDLVRCRMLERHLITGRYIHELPTRR